jgi:poly(A) polymerase Pap1
MKQTIMMILARVATTYDLERKDVMTIVIIVVRSEDMERKVFTRTSGRTGKVARRENMERRKDMMERTTLVLMLAQNMEISANFQMLVPSLTICTKQ